MAALQKGIAPIDVRSAARRHTKLAIRRLKEICAKSKSDSAAAMAATALLDRGWGKPEQQVEITAKIPDTMSDAELNAELERIGRLIELQANPATQLLPDARAPASDLNDINDLD